MDAALEAWALAHGPLGLFLVAFLAATLLPLSSEVALVGALIAAVPPERALVAASVGNGLACLFNYGLGALFHRRAAAYVQASWGGVRALETTRRFGSVALLGSWLPIVGDPITIVAGLLRIPLAVFILIVLPLRVLRYVVIAWPWISG